MANDAWLPGPPPTRKQAWAAIEALAKRIRDDSTRRSALSDDEREYEKKVVASLDAIGELGRSIREGRPPAFSADMRAAAKRVVRDGD